MLHLGIVPAIGAEERADLAGGLSGCRWRCLGMLAGGVFVAGGLALAHVIATAHIAGKECLKQTLPKLLRGLPLAPSSDSAPASNFPKLVAGLAGFDGIWRDFTGLPR